MTVRRLQLTLLVTAAAATIVMAGLLATGYRIACLAIVVAGTLATAGERHRRGGGWWTLLAAGTALSVVAAAIAWISEPAESAAGIAAIAGAALVVVAATIGFPLRGR